MADHRKRYGATPTFDELFDCARGLGTCELLLERTEDQAASVLFLVVRSVGDGRVVHRARVRRSVEDAACRIRDALPGRYREVEET